MSKPQSKPLKIISFLDKIEQRKEEGNPVLQVKSVKAFRNKNSGKKNKTFYIPVKRKTYYITVYDNGEKGKMIQYGESIPVGGGKFCLVKDNEPGYLSRCLGILSNVMTPILVEEAKAGFAKKAEQGFAKFSEKQKKQKKQKKKKLSVKKICSEGESELTTDGGESDGGSATVSEACSTESLD